MERIVLLGRAGVGKTRLAKRIGEETGADVVCLDSIWQPAWGPDDVPTFRELLREAHSGTRWVSDGNFAVASFRERLPRATLIVWQEAPKLVCSWRVVRRALRKGEPHRLRDCWKVLAFIWRFDRVNRPRIEAERLKHGPLVPVVHLRNDVDATRLIALLRVESPVGA